MIINRKIVFGALIWAVMLILAGCQSKPEGEKGIVLKFMTGGSLEEKKIYEEFEAAYPGISVRLEWYAGGHFFETLLTRIAGGAGPDLTYINGARIYQFAGKNALEDLSPYIEKEKDFDLSDFYDRSLRDLTVDGKLYALPWSMGVWVLAYNKKMFDEEKIPYPDESWTWDDMLEAAKKLTKRDKSGRINRFGFAAPGGLWSIFGYSSGKKFYNEAGTECLIDDPDIVKMREFYEDLSKKYHVSPTPSEEEQQQATDFFPSGRAAMTFVGRWMVPVYNAKKGLEWDIAPMPKGKVRATVMHTPGYAICKGSKYKNEAWTFLKYLTGPQGSSRMAQLGISIPARKSIAREYVKDHPGVQPEHEGVFLKAIDYAVTKVKVKNSERIEEVIRMELDLSMLGKVTAEEALRRAKKKVDAILEEPE